LKQAKIDWHRVFAMAQCQQVYAIVFDGLKTVYDLLQKEELQAFHYPCVMEFYSKAYKKLKMEWMSMIVADEEYFEKQLTAVSELGKLWAENGLRPVVIKGMAHAQYFPFPNHRISTDIDTFFPNQWEESNQLVEALNIVVDRDYYKNSTFIYNEVIIENHHFCTQVRGNKRRKQYERYLQALVADGSLDRVMETDMYCPPSMFTALYFMSHAQTHFIMDGGLSLKHICDWGMLMKAFAAKLDWAEFDRQCKNYGMEHFAWAMLHVAKRVTGVEVPYDCPRIKEELIALVQEIMSPQQKAVDHNAGKLSVWIQVINNFLHSGWKYKMFSDQGMVATLFQTIRAFVFERTPHI